MSTADAGTSPHLSSIVDRMGLKTLVEACLVLEEGVASAKDIEVGMMMGAGIALALGAGRDRRRADRAAPALPSRSFRALDA